MSIDIVKTTDCEAPLDVVFAYVADYRNVPDWLFGVQTFEPVGDIDHGLGAVFDGADFSGARVTADLQGASLIDATACRSLVASTDTQAGLFSPHARCARTTGSDSTTTPAFSSPARHQVSRIPGTNSTAVHPSG